MKTARARLDEEYQRDRARLQSERDAKIEKIRRGDAANESSERA